MIRHGLALGALSALISVAAGAFAAHALKRVLSAEALATFEIAARYQMYHALGLIAVGLLAGRAAPGPLSAAGWLFVVGTLLFSGSLYLLALTGLRALAWITPFGGALFLAGWGALAIAAIRAGAGR